MLNAEHGPDDHVPDTGIPNEEDSWIKTYSGRRFFPFSTEARDIEIADIAHPLSMQVRFNGHIDRLYSVGQHSINVCDVVSDRAKPFALMHDAPEAFIGDMASPIKWHFPKFRSLDDSIMRAIIQRFNIPVDRDIFEEVKAADTWLVFQEGDRMLTNPETEYWQSRSSLQCVTREFTINEEAFDELHWRDTKRMFLRRFDRLIGGRV